MSSRHPELDSGSINVDLSRKGRTLREEWIDSGSESGMTKMYKVQGDKIIKNLFTYSPTNLLTSKKAAFTLAEVLITLAIIGVVAAMTIPTLISDYQEKVTVTKLKKMYYTLSNAYRMYTAENGAIQAEWTAEGAKKVFDAFKPYLKISKECGTSHEGCIIEGSYNRLNSDRTDLNYGGVDTYYKARLSDGAALIFRGIDDTSAGVQAFVYYDINAEDGPNRWGHDLFEFNVMGESLIPAGFPNYPEDFDTTCSSTEDYGYGCAAWIINKGNMDYLNCSHDLTWSDSKCE